MVSCTPFAADQPPWLLADELRALMQAVLDAPLVAYLLEGTTIVAADRPDPVELNALGRLPPSD